MQRKAGTFRAEWKSRKNENVLIKRKFFLHQKLAIKISSDENNFLSFEGETFHNRKLKQVGSQASQWYF